MGSGLPELCARAGGRAGRAEVEAAVLQGTASLLALHTGSMTKPHGGTWNAALWPPDHQPEWHRHGFLVLLDSWIREQAQVETEHFQDDF